MRLAAWLPAENAKALFGGGGGVGDGGGGEAAAATPDATSATDIVGEIALQPASASPSELAPLLR